MSTAVIGIFLAGCLLATGCVQHHHHTQPVIVEPQPPAGGPVGADPVVDMFYNDLAPYGEWFYIDGPGWVWAPYDVEADWRPYQYGHWVYTDYGWTWASDEEFGWAVYHYGRWHQAPRYGWVWVPGPDWGPAWVAWQESDDWIGWAPLPYYVGWRAGVGLDWGQTSVHVAIQSGHWSFVATRYIVEPQVYRHVAPRARNTTYINVTRNVTNYTYIDNRVINNSVQVNKVVRAIGHPVTQHHVRHADNPGRARGGQDDGDDLVIYRPREHPGRDPQRREVPPGHADEHQGKKDRQGRANDRGTSDRNARPAVDRPDQGEPAEDHRTSQPPTRPRRNSSDVNRRGATPPVESRDEQRREAPGRKQRPAPPDERGSKSAPGEDQPNGDTRTNRPQAAPSDRAHDRGPGNRTQAAPPPGRAPRNDARPAPSDVDRSGAKKSPPAASQPTPRGKSAKDSDTKQTRPKDEKSSRGKGKSGKSKPADSEEEEDSSEEGAKKRG